MKMEKLAGFRLLVVFLAALNSAVAEKKQVYVSDGGVLQLRPVFSQPITSVLWKLNNNLLVDWTKVPPDLEYYPNFIGRTTLNITSGHLEMSRMTGADSGQYTVDINGVIQSVSYNVKVIKEVPKPKVFVQPLTCSPESDSCTLTCDGITDGAEPVSYSVKKGDGQWEPMNSKSITITKADTAHAETLSCRMKNPVSEKASEAEPNPLFQPEESDSTWIVVVVIVAVIVIVAVVVVVVVVVYKYWAAIQKFFRELFGSSTATANGGKDPVNSTEILSLNAAKN